MCGGGAGIDVEQVLVGGCATVSTFSGGRCIVGKGAVDRGEDDIGARIVVDRGSVDKGAKMPAEFEELLRWFGNKGILGKGIDCLPL